MFCFIASLADSTISDATMASVLPNKLLIFAPRICSLFLGLQLKYEFGYRLATSCHFQSHKTRCPHQLSKDLSFSVTPKPRTVCWIPGLLCFKFHKRTQPSNHHRRNKQEQTIILSMSNKVVHSLTTMMNMKLTATAFKRKNPATAALEESLRVDELLAPMQRKRRRQSLEGDCCSNKISPYGMSGIWRETEKLENTLAFPTIEWSFDDDVSIASERGVPFNDDECIQSRQSPNSATCLNPAALQITSPRLLSKKSKSSNSNSLHSLQWMPELSSREERTRSFLHALGATEQLKPPSRTA
jgi:hypothetical protein